MNKATVLYIGDLEREKKIPSEDLWNLLMKKTERSSQVFCLAISKTCCTRWVRCRAQKFFYHKKLLQEKLKNSVEDNVVRMKVMHGIGASEEVQA